MTQLVGILNLTPDSFSDGGMFADTASAVTYAEQLIEAGAAVLDIGAESTRPGATPVKPDEEWRRLQPVLKALAPLAHSAQVALSIDTRHADTAARALDMGAHWINDVTGFADAAMRRAVQGYDAKLVIMHSLSVPADRGLTLPEEEDAVSIVTDALRHRAEELMGSGIARERLVLDPGIGFGKTTAQNWALLQRVDELAALGFPLLIGHSRKSFLNAVFEGAPEERDGVTLAVSQYLVQKQVAYLRVHDVAGHRSMLNVLGKLE